MKDEILEEFKSQKKTFNAFKDRMINLLRDLIEKEKIVPHQITGRVKDTQSLSKKIDKKGEKYNCLDDITDVVGLRIITYLESDVDPIALIIEKEFLKDEQNSIDKRILKTDQFGYKSLHVVVSLNDKRIKLPEYSNYKTIKCEIQIRSILQHAWAEIEHDLGYKGADIPDEYKRSFNRVAALLEVADIEFVNLKSQLSKYEENVPSLIENSPQDVDLNRASLNFFLKTDLTILDLRQLIVDKTGILMSPFVGYELIIKLLNDLEIASIEQLKKSLKENKKKYFQFVEVFIKEYNLHGSLSETVLLMYFCHFLAAKSEDLLSIEKYLTAFKGEKNIKGFAKKLLNVFDASKEMKN